MSKLPYVMMKYCFCYSIGGDHICFNKYYLNRNGGIGEARAAKGALTPQLIQNQDSGDLTNALALNRFAPSATTV